MANERYQGEVAIFDPLAYQKVLQGLEELDGMTEQEMRAMANLTGSTMVDMAYDWLAKKLGQVVLNQLTRENARDVLGYLTGTTIPPGGAPPAQELADMVGAKALQLRLSLQEVGLLSGDDGIAFDGMTESIARSLGDGLAKRLGKTPGSLLDWISEGGISPANLKRWLTENVAGPGVYAVFCQEKQNLIRSRTAETATKLYSRPFTPDEIDAIREVLAEGQRALHNTSTARIYRLQAGPLPVSNQSIVAAPTLLTLMDSHQESMNPGGWPGIGKYRPGWAWDMTMADLQSVLTLPAKLGWIEATPDKQFRAQAVPIIALLVKGAIAYIKYVNLLDKTSPWIISGGMTLGTDLLAQSVDYKHQQILQAALAGQGLQGLVFTAPSVNPQSAGTQENPSLSITVTSDKITTSRAKRPR